MKFTSVEQMLAAVAAMVRPPERLTVSQAAEKYRYLPGHGGGYVGMWDNRIAPYLVEPMDTLTSLDYTGMVFAGPARTGKSVMFDNWLTHTAICDPADMMLIHMTQNTARDYSQLELARLFRHSKAVGKTLVPGRQNDNVHDKRFLSGMRLLIKWPTITELSGKTIPRLWLMDYDRMTDDVDGEGAPYDLARKRSQTFGRHGMTVAESSPGWEVEDPKWRPSTPHEAPPTPGILALYNRGDRRRWYWQCPHCRESFEPDFTLLKWPELEDRMEAAERAYMVAPCCGGVIQYKRDRETGMPGQYELNLGGKWIKDGMKWNADGTITGTPFRSEIASFWMKGPAAAFTDWRTLVLRYLTAMDEFEKTGTQEALKATVNTDQGLPFKPFGIGSSRLPEVLKARAIPLGEKVVPEGVRFLVATVDVQKNLFVVQVHGFGHGGDIWVIDRFRIRVSERMDEETGQYRAVNPGGYPEDWHHLIEQVLEKTYPLADGSGRRMQIKAVGCDSGGAEGVTANAYNFYRYLRTEHDGGHHRRFHLLKGGSQKGAARVRLTYPDSQQRKDRMAGAMGEIPVLMLNTDMLKDQLNSMLDRTDPEGGYINFPDWLPDWFYSELTVEERTAKGWANTRGSRNEAWDLLTYAIAISIMTGPNGINIEKLDWDNPPRWAAEWDINELVIEDESKKKFVNHAKGDYDLAKLGSDLA